MWSPRPRRQRRYCRSCPIERLKFAVEAHEPSACHQVDRVEDLRLDGGVRSLFVQPDDQLGERVSIGRSRELDGCYFLPPSLDSALGDATETLPPGQELAARRRR
jgi:hypothetical protein